MAQRVLIVDDNADIRVLFSELFKSLGVQVESVSDGAGCMTAIDHSIEEAKPFDLIVLDVMMPGKKGTDVAKELRDRGYKGKIAVCTACASGVGRKESRTNGVDHYFDKAVVNRNLFSALLAG